MANVLVGGGVGGVQVLFGGNMGRRVRPGLIRRWCGAGGLEWLELRAGLFGRMVSCGIFLVIWGKGGSVRTYGKRLFFA